ncbi:MAG: anti-sigma factor [Rubrobacter sp.]|nr:anti-sigma factor [Rubrobacter sp.]
MSEDRFENLLGPYVLGELTDAEEQELERHLEGCATCREDLDDVRHAHATLRTAVDGPPPELKDWVLARARNEPRHSPAAGWKLWLPASAAVLLVAAVLGFAVLRTISGPSEGLALAATSAAPQAGGELRGEQVGDNLKVELEAWGLPEPRGGEYYEMWYAREDGGRISCGTFHAQPKGHTTVNMSAPASAVAYPEVEITLEPDDGDPGSSGRVVLKGSLRDLGA